MAIDNNVQNKTAKEIMQSPDTVSIGGETYRIYPPSFGTLVAVSSMIRLLPEGGMDLTKGMEVETIVGEAHKYGVVPRIVALLILGAKEAREPSKSSRTGIFSILGTKLRRSGGNAKMTKLDELARKIEDTASASELKDAVVPLIERLELKDFFVLTTFLQRLNVTKPTKVESEATAPGRS